MPRAISSLRTRRMLTWFVPAVGLALYGYALVRFPSVSWYVPQFNSVRTVPSRRHAAMA